MNNRTFQWLFAAITLVYLPGFVVEVMGVDSSQYALISREMVETGSYLEVFQLGRDYLDKPPLLFWVNSVFFQIFGYHNWSFKIGSFLFTLLGVYSTFRLGKLLYSAKTGRLAAILLYSCQAMFLINNDVRTDTILIASAVFAIWQIMAWLETRKWLFLFGASLGLAMAMLTKGPIGVMVPALAVGGYLLGKKEWRNFLRWEYLVMLALTLVLISPMLWGLYHQFDLQPDKEVVMATSDGVKVRTGVSGLQFYLWDQSFGRITGESDWSNDAGPFFFVGSFIWSFIPWSLTFILALMWQFRRVGLALQGKARMPELLTLLGFILPFIVFSMSSYKLPHYIFILFPLAAILTAHWWQSIYELPGAKYWRIASYTVQQITLTAVTMALVLVMFRVFPGNSWILLIACLILILMASYLVAQGTESFMPVVMSSVMIALAANLVMNMWFYPQLMQYQPGATLAEAIESRGIPQDKINTYRFGAFSFDYYMDLRKRPKVSPSGIEQKLAEQSTAIVVTDEQGRRELAENFESKVLFEMPTHSVTRLNKKFLDHRTREETLESVYLLELSAKRE